MILAVDVHYSHRGATVAGVLFHGWKDENPVLEVASFLDATADYRPGEFYLRELPPIMRLIEEHGLFPECIVVDGFVYLDGVSTPGLGKRLFDALGGTVTVIGVAKNRFRGIGERYAVFRGSSRRPLYVTAAGMGLENARGCILRMHGNYRIPTMLKLVDRLSRRG
jgi:deoxyribonuclease V